MELSPFRVASILQTIVSDVEEDDVPKILLRQLSDTLGTGLPEGVSILRRSPKVFLAPDEVQVTKGIEDNATTKGATDVR